MKKSIDIFVIPLAMTCLVMILLSGCSNNDSHIIPSQGYAMASEHSLHQPVIETSYTYQH